MPVDVKICGLLDDVSLAAVVDAGACYVGFNFHLGSRHLLTPEAAGALARQVPPQVTRVGLFVDADDATLQTTLMKVPLDMVQLHGDETPQRVAAIRAITGKPVMAALRVATEEHLTHIADYEAVADMLLFDARVGKLPTGGTGQSFDWSLLRGRTFTKPWMLAGGLNIDNLTTAVAATGARIVDLASGVETGGHKDPDKIRSFIRLAQSL